MAIIQLSKPKEHNLILELIRFFLAISIMLLHIFNFSYDLTEKPFLHYNYIADFFFVISGVVLYDFYYREFATKSVFQASYFNFFRKRFKRFFPALFIAIIFSTFILYLEKFLISFIEIDRTVNVYPERNIFSIVLALSFLQIFNISAFFILPNAWGVSVEFLANIIMMFKYFVKNNYTLIFLACLGVLAMQLGLKYHWYPAVGNYGSSGIPALGRALVGLCAGFLAKRNADFFYKFYSRKIFIFLIFVLILSFRFPVYELTTNPFLVDFLFGVILVYVMKYNFTSTSKISKISYVGGGLAYPFYLLHGSVLDLVNFTLNKPVDFNIKYPEDFLSLIVRISLTFFITFVLAFFVENLIRKLMKQSKLTFKK